MLSHYCLLALPSFFISFSIIGLVAAQHCYWAVNDTIVRAPSYFTPCAATPDISSTYQCCDTLPNSICLFESLCYNPYANVYSLSPYTDNSFRAPECAHRYSKFVSTQILDPTSLNMCAIHHPWHSSGNRTNPNELSVIWDEKASIWRCCGLKEDGKRDCDHPTSEWFSGPAPPDLSVLYPKDRWTAPLPLSSEQYSPLVSVTEIAVAESVTTSVKGA